MVTTSYPRRIVELQPAGHDVVQEELANRCAEEEVFQQIQAMDDCAFEQSEIHGKLRR
jgi:hypothetical protein